MIGVIHIVTNIVTSVKNHFSINTEEDSVGCCLINTIGHQTTNDFIMG